MRKFADWAERIAADWMETPVQTIPVVQLTEFSNSADGACRASFGEDERIGFVKPREEKGSRVIAHEKIASDIGKLLGLPVAPVVIREKEADAPWDRLTALSLSCLASPRHWGDAPLPLDDDVVNVLESLRVFWTWLGDTDHNNHPHNLLYELPVRGRPRFAAIDHSYIFPEGADPLTAPVCGGYDTASHAAAPQARQRTLDAIEALDVARLQHVVRRLVGTALTDDQADRIIAWLESRRPLLRGMF